MRRFPGLRPRVGGLLHVLVFGALALPAPADAQVDADRLAAMQARNIGPAGMSGRVTSIAALEADPNVVYIGSASGGVWKSTNAGDTWTPIFDDQRVAGIGAVAVHPTHRDVVWVGTGEGNPRNSADVGAGIWRSLDGGDSWTFLGLEDTRQIHRILLHPTDPDVAWVGALGPIWSDGEDRGVFRTTDGGRTWEKVLYVDERTGVADMVQDPHNPNKIFAALWSFRRYPWFFESGGEGSGLYLTWDGGDTWEELGPDEGLPGGTLGRMGLAIARSNPQTVYALIEAERGRGLYRSEDGGRRWRAVNTDAGVLNRPFYYAEIHVDPENELRIYNLSSRVTISEDGGRSFQPMQSDVHSDFHAMWIDPSDSRRIYLGNDGGFVISSDRARTWRVTDNLPLGQFYHISVDNDVPYNVYGGMQDNGSWKGPSDVWEVDGIRNWKWVETAFGDGFNTMVDPREPWIGYAMSQGGNLTRFDVRTGERKSIRPYHPEDSVELRFHWNAALALDPHEIGTVYYGSQFLHRSRDRGNSWETLSPDLTTDDPEKQKQGESGGLTRDVTGAENHTTILTIAPSPLERGLIWVGTDDGNVQMTRDGGASWTNLIGNIDGPAENTWVAHIEASRHDAGTAYVVFDDHRRGRWDAEIYKTTDYGRSWSNVARGIDGYALTVEEDPVVPGLLYAGSEFGLWVTLDDGGTWTKWTHGFPTVPVRSLVVHPRDHDLVIGTFGRAIWVLDDVRPLRDLARSGTPDGAVHLFEAPDAWIRRTRAVDGYHFSGDAMFEGETRPEGALLSYWVADGGDAERVDIEILDERGSVLRSFEGPADTGMNRIAWNLRADLPGGDDEGQGGGFFRPSGPEVLPGTYTVRVSLDGASSERSLTVHPDPRVEVSMADRRAKYDAVVRGLELNRRFTAAQRKVREVREAADKVLEFVEGQEGEAIESLREAGRELKRRLDDDVDFDPASSQRRTVFGLQSTWEAPSEAERLGLERMERALADLEAEIDALLQGPAADFRRQAQQAGVTLVPEFERLGGG